MLMVSCSKVYSRVKKKKKKKEEKKRITIFCVSSLEDFALVVMVMPCWLTDRRRRRRGGLFCPEYPHTHTHTHTLSLVNIQYGALKTWSILTELPSTIPVQHLGVSSTEGLSRGSPPQSEGREEGEPFGRVGLQPT